MIGPAGVTEVIAGPPARPPLTSEKSPASTPETVSEKVTVQVTDEATVGFVSPRFIEVTVGGVVSRLPTAKSLKALKPVPVAVVAVLVPEAGAVQVDEANLRTTSALAVVTVPASRSPATKVNAVEYVVNVMPEGVSVQKRLTEWLGSIPEDQTFAWSPAVAEAVSVPATETEANVTVTGEYVDPVPTSNVRATLLPVVTGLRRLPMTKPLVRVTVPFTVRTLAPVVTVPLVSVRALGRVVLLPRLTPAALLMV